MIEKKKIPYLVIPNRIILLSKENIFPNRAREQPNILTGVRDPQVWVVHVKALPLGELGVQALSKRNRSSANRKFPQ